MSVAMLHKAQPIIPPDLREKLRRPVNSNLAHKFMTTHLSKLSVIVSLVVLSWDASAETHCKPGEAVYFSCRIKNSQKIVSLCGPVAYQDADTGKVSKGAWLQYRFGKLGKVELAYPTDKESSLEKFKFEHARHNHGFDDTVSFENSGVWYALESLEGAEDEKDNFYGVEFAPVGNNPTVKLPTRLACQGMPQGDISSLAQGLDPTNRLQEQVNTVIEPTP